MSLVNTRRGRSAAACAPPVCSARWDRSATPTTDAYDNSVAESFFGTLQLELLDEHRWSTRNQLAQAIFEWIECWYNPSRRHTSIGMHSPIDYEAAHAQNSLEPAA